MTAVSTDFAQALRDAGLRVTQQRMIVMSVLMDSVDHPNADELFARTKAIDGSVSFATVYRTLAALEEAGDELVNNLQRLMPGATAQVQMLTL